MLSLFPDLLTYQEIAPFLLRLSLGLILLLRGYFKLKKTFAPIETLLVLSSVMLILGVFVQPAALLIFLLTLIKIFLAKDKTEYSLKILILASALSLLFLGAGILSFDLPL